MKRKYVPSTEEEKEYIETYDGSAYEKPSITADVVIMTLIPGRGLGVLLTRRDEFPYKGRWALPGGFVGISESIEDTAQRKLEEKAGIKNIPFYQFGTFGAVDRDPRMRVISVSYMAFVPVDRLSLAPGVGADQAGIFLITGSGRDRTFVKDSLSIKEEDLAFDHAEIIDTAMMRLRNRIDYTDDALAFVNADSFTITQVREIFESVKGKKEDPGNFRRDFIKKYEKTGIVESIKAAKSGDVGRPAVVYRIIRKEKKHENNPSG